MIDRCFDAAILLAALILGLFFLASLIFLAVLVWQAASPESGFCFLYIYSSLLSMGHIFRTKDFNRRVLYLDKKC